MNSHIEIYCRSSLYIDGGVANAIPPHVTHPPVAAANEGNPIQVSVSFTVSGGSSRQGGGGVGTAVATLEVYDDQTGTKVASKTSASTVLGNVTLMATIPAVKLWSPEACNLYRAVVTLAAPATSTSSSTTLGGGAAVLDTATTRFGVRTIVTDGYKFMLNGRRVFLTGFGDDAIYPRTVSPPRNKSFYEKKVGVVRSLGFNFVRHHSHVLPTEYFDAADELGLMVSPELPCAYGKYYRATDAAGQALYAASWTQYVSALRNHPSIFDWAMCV